jgi:hypothetical protein
VKKVREKPEKNGEKEMLANKYFYGLMMKTIR